MKRFTIKLVLFLLAGAIINVCVAWGFAYRITFDEIDQFVHIGSKDLAFRHRVGSEWAADGIAPYMQHVFESKLAGKPIMFKSVEEEPKALWRAILDDPEVSGYEAHGWPRLSLAWLYLGAGPDNQIRTLPEVRYGIHVSGSKDMHRYMLNGHVLPLRPLWPGFAINTIFYAAVFWMIFAVPGALRRRVRIKRGQCAACGYSLRGSADAICSECGSQLK